MVRSKMRKLFGSYVPLSGAVLTAAVPLQLAVVDVDTAEPKETEKIREKVTARASQSVDRENEIEERQKECVLKQEEVEEVVTEREQHGKCDRKLQSLITPTSTKKYKIESTLATYSLFQLCNTPLLCFSSCFLGCAETLKERHLSCSVLLAHMDSSEDSRMHKC